MNWQEYQEAVGELYAQMEDIGRVSKNITLPDKITGHPRQIDVWLEIEAKSHQIGILIDAKYRKDKIDVRDVEAVLSLANAVGANKSVLVALKGWTKPAEIKAQAVGLDLRLLTLEQALDLIVPDKWIVCPVCGNDCIVMDCAGGMVIDNMWSLLTAGRCRECQTALVYCWTCGDRMLLKLKEQMKCDCGHLWKNITKSIMVRIRGDKNWNEVSKDLPLLDPDLADFHIRKGMEYKINGDIAAAIEEFTKAIEMMPIAAIPYYHRGITYDEHGYLEQAIEDYTKAIELHPKYAMAYGSRGIACYASGRFQEAISDLEQYLFLEPNSPDRTRIENAIRQAKLKIR